MVIMNITVIFLLEAIAYLCFGEIKESSSCKAYAYAMKVISVLFAFGGVLFTMYTLACYTDWPC